MRHQVKKKTVSIIGHFGGNERFTDGQTVKTLNLYYELRENTDWDLQKVDTYYARRNPLRLLGETIYATLSSKDIIILLSVNGMKMYFPLLNRLSRMFGKRIYHDVIGGRLEEEVKQHPQYKDYLNSFRVNWVETRKLKLELEEAGIRNAEILPNFRRMEPLREEDLNVQFEEPFSFCTFSRVIEEKGIEDAICAVQSINADRGRTACKLCIYGPIEEGYRARFEEVMRGAGPAVRYCGEVPSDQATQTISPFFATLFPTRWIGESNAGTVTESFFAGVPVLATDWRCNSEMITNGYNGLVYPGPEAKTLKEAMLWLMDNREKIGAMKKNCLESARMYQPDRYIRQVIEFISGTNSEKSAVGRGER